MANTELWDSVGRILDAVEELERIIDGLVPGSSGAPIRTVIADLADALDKSEAGFRGLLADPDMPGTERADCQEAVEALASLTVRLERTRRRLDGAVARNRKRLIRRVLVSAVLTAIVSYVACTGVVLPHPALHLLANALVGLLVGIGFGLLFVVFYRWWDRPVR